MSLLNKTKTQGEAKMERYIEDLIRNKDFLRRMKRLRRNSGKQASGMYDTWTEKQRLEHDHFNKELGEILDGYETLRKRTKKIFNSRDSKTRVNY